MTDEFRKEAEEHWVFVAKLLTHTLASMKKENAELAHSLYVEGMIHGYKHCKQEMQKL